MNSALFGEKNETIKLPTLFYLSFYEIASCPALRHIWSVKTSAVTKQDKKTFSKWLTSLPWK